MPGVAYMMIRAPRGSWTFAGAEEGSRRRWLESASPPVISPPRKGRPSMKLYNANLSNFASKCRLAIYEKGAPVEIVPIPGGDLKSPEYLKIYPMGKTPSLEVDGQILGESEVINEYLEEKFPQKPLLPKDAESRARVRAISRFHDLYLEPPLRALFPQVTAKDKDQKLIAEKL